jgi:hypothetical protein
MRSHWDAQQQQRFGGGREVVGHRLSYDGLLFVRNFVFPPKHADLLSVRGSYKKHGARASSANRAKTPAAEDTEDETGAFDQSA